MMPIVARASELVLRLVPGTLQEGSYALGASHWRTVTNVVLPTARSGLATAVVLCDGPGHRGDRAGPGGIRRDQGDEPEPPARPADEPAVVHLGLRARRGGQPDRRHPGLRGRAHPGGRGRGVVRRGPGARWQRSRRADPATAAPAGHGRRHGHERPARQSDAAPVRQDPPEPGCAAGPAAAPAGPAGGRPRRGGLPGRGGAARRGGDALARLGRQPKRGRDCAGAAHVGPGERKAVSRREHRDREPDQQPGQPDGARVVDRVHPEQHGALRPDAPPTTRSWWPSARARTRPS